MIKIMLDTPVAKRSTLESRGGREQYVEESEREHDVAVELWEFVQGLVKKKTGLLELDAFRNALHHAACTGTAVSVSRCSDRSLPKHLDRLLDCDVTPAVILARLTLYTVVQYCSGSLHI